MDAETDCPIKVIVLTQIGERYLLDSRHLIEQFHEKSVQVGFIILLRSLNQLYQFRESTLIVKELESTLCCTSIR
jgi:hypothetical protein